jgi:hypothetical protein
VAKYQAGQSGNPKGRPKGVVNQQRLREAIIKDVPAIIAALSQKAQEGDVQASRLLLDRVFPTLKAVDTPAPVNMPPTLEAAPAALMQALAAGTVTPDQAQSMAQVIVALARAKETAELEARIAALEAGRAANP